MVSRELDKECVIVFDEAHNIDNVCIEASPLLGSAPREAPTEAFRPGLQDLAAVADHACGGTPSATPS